MSRRSALLRVLGGLLAIAAVLAPSVMTATAAPRVIGAISDEWHHSRAVVGEPLEPEFCSLRDDGCAQRFAQGSIYWSMSSGSYAVVGRIFDYWGSQGWETGRYGYPTSHESCVLDDDVRTCTQDFQGGRITWRSDTGIVNPAEVDCAVQRCVALTYDDGPGAHTNRLLDILGRANAKATFFVVGTNVSRDPATVRRMRDLGMELGNHTISHPNLTGLGTGSVNHQLADSNRRIREAAGVTPTWMRPPYGARNSTVDAMARTNGLAVALWDVDTNDWRDRNAATVTSRVLNQARPGSVILMHDIHRSTVDAAPAIISGLRERGYVLVTMSQLVETAEPGRVYLSR